MSCAQVMYQPYVPYLTSSYDRSTASAAAASAASTTSSAPSSSSSSFNGESPEKVVYIHLHTFNQFTNLDYNFKRSTDCLNRMAPEESMTSVITIYSSALIMEPELQRVEPLHPALRFLQHQPLPLLHPYLLQWLDHPFYS